MNSKIASCRTLLKSNWREKTSKIVIIADHRCNAVGTRKRQPSTVNIRHPPDRMRKPLLQFRYLPKCVARVRDLTSLTLVLSSMVVDNDYQRSCDDLKTTSLETASHDMETSKKRGLRSPTKSKQNHNELLCRHIIFNMLKICRRTRRVILAVCGRYWIRQRKDGNTRWLAGNSKLQFAA